MKLQADQCARPANITYVCNDALSTSLWSGDTSRIQILFLGKGAKTSSVKLLVKLFAQKCVFLQWTGNSWWRHLQSTYEGLLGLNLVTRAVFQKVRKSFCDSDGGHQP